MLRERFVPAEIAEELRKPVAACLSVLTDRSALSGQRNGICAKRARRNLPVIRKDFIVDAYQV